MSATNMTVNQSKSMLRTPAVEALIIQCLSFVVVVLLANGIAILTGYELTLAVVALIQGSLASAVSRWRHMASWWLLIQFLFPLAILSVQALHLPPVIFLVAFIFFLGLYWTTFRTQVPFYPSGLATWKAVADLLPPEGAVKFIDIGSGLGGLILNLAKRRPDSTFVGIELAPLPWLISVLRATVERSRCRFFRGDYNHLNFSDYDVVFAYLSPAAMSALWEKAHAEMRPGTLLLSYEFLISARKPDITIRPANQAAELYGWRLK